MQNILPPDLLTDGFEIKEEVISQIDNEEEEDKFEDEESDQAIPEPWETKKSAPEKPAKKRKSSFKVGFDMQDFDDGLQQIEEVSESDLTTVKSLGQSVMSLNSFSKNRKMQSRRDLKELPSPQFTPKFRFQGNR